MTAKTTYNYHLNLLPNPYWSSVLEAFFFLQELKVAWYFIFLFSSYYEDFINYFLLNNLE